MKKSEREIVFNKYGGKCAYCGCYLQKGWHVDHAEPVIRKTKTVHQHWKHEETGEVLHQNEYLKKFRGLNEEAALNGGFSKWRYVERKEVPDGYHRPENHCIENMMPSCQSCNINKHGATIEEFRGYISGYLNSLNLRMVQYKMVKKYGLVEETGKPVVFFFEMFNRDKNDERSVAREAK
jgi:hypothetical protein